MANVRDRLFRVRIFTETMTTINFKERQRKERIWVGRRGKLQPASLKVADSKVPGSNPVWKPFFFSRATNGWFAIIGKLKQYGDFNKLMQRKRKNWAWHQFAYKCERSVYRFGSHFVYNGPSLPQNTLASGITTKTFTIQWFFFFPTNCLKSLELHYHSLITAKTVLKIHFGPMKVWLVFFFVWSLY